MSWFRSAIQEELPKIIVETGTYLGDGVSSYIGYFDKIYSIELSEKYCQMAKAKFKSDSSIEIIQGDSAQILRTDIFPHEPILFYLDAHFAGGETSDNGCPLIEELEAIVARKVPGDVIVIDDMRLMGKADWAGTDGDDVYPRTFFDFTDITETKIREIIGSGYTIVDDRLIMKMGPVCTRKI